MSHERVFSHVIVGALGGAAWSIQIQWLINFYEEFVYPDAFKYSDLSQQRGCGKKKMLLLLAIKVFSAKE